MERLYAMIATHQKEIDTLNYQRRLWLYGSNLVFILVIVIIYILHDDKELEFFWWAVGSVGLVISVNWWYWTMRVINTLLNHRDNECIILSEIITEMTDVQKFIKQEFK